MNVLVKHLSSTQVQNLESEFAKLDSDGSGMLEIDELTKAIRNSDVQITEQEIKQIVKEVDYQGNGKINYSEFISSTIDTKQFLNEARLQAIFQSFDIDNTQFISIQNLKDAFTKFGREITNAEIEQVMKEHDRDGNQQIDFSEFKTMMMGDFKFAE
jgi:Ca2+-binding EF-hand superfamily protein